jgi:hypothetical protein
MNVCSQSYLGIVKLANVGISGGGFFYKVAKRMNLIFPGY